MTQFVGAAFITPLHTTYQVFDEDRKPLLEKQIRLNTYCNDARKTLLNITNGLKAEARKFASDARFTEVGIAVAGQVRGGKIVQASRLHPWKGEPIEEIVSRALGGARVSIGNDAEARTRWESSYSEKLSRTLAGQSFMTLYWGEGIGGAYSDYRGNIKPLEPGHVPVWGLSTHELLPCVCSTHPGCLDSHAGGARIAENLRKSGSGYLSVEDASAYASLVAGVYKKLIKQHPSDYLVVGGQRLKIHDNLGKHLGVGNPSLTQLLERQLEIHIPNVHMRPKVLRSELWYAPAETALTLLDRSAKSLVGVR